MTSLRLRVPLGAPGWRRTALVRRTAAGLLVVLALALALAPQAAAGGTPVVVAAADLPAGSTLSPEGLAVREWPPELVPAGAVVAVADAAGRVLVGAARAGEPLTDARLTDATTVGGDDAAVPVRLADPDVAALLVAGRRVDVVTLGERAGEPLVLASDAQVVTVLPGPLVLVAMPRGLATRVAAAALSDQVAVTLR
ncbi:SAF domain-containing protein [Pseudonocardia saturnea]